MKAIGFAVVRSNPQSRKAKGKFSPSHEYALFYGASEKSIPGSLELTAKRLARYPKEDAKGRFSWMSFIRTGTDDKREDRPEMHFPIYVNKEDKLRIPKMTWSEDQGAYNIEEKPKPGEVAVYPVSAASEVVVEKRWHRGFQRVVDEPEEFRVRRDDTGHPSIDFKTRIDEDSTPATWWDKNEYASSNYGAADLKGLFGKKEFDFPKALGLVLDSIRACNPTVDSKILDYFGGSGTTAHAVINLNREDGGRRQFIVVEMGKHFDAVLLPRVKKIAFAPKWAEGKPVEGWNSWRVSTMGLMNVGQTEGSQIIQLFGRGVRLKGYGSSLKRSGKAQLPDDMTRPKHISVLETLSIFGIRADYMAQFRDFLEEEGLPSNDDRIEFMLPIIKNLGTQKLKTIRLKNKINGVSTEFGDAFRRLGPVPTLATPNPAKDEATVYLQNNQVVLNWYPKIQAMKSGGVAGGDAEAAPNQAHFSAKHIAFMDLDQLYFELERFKAERGWYNLNLSSEALASLLADQSWYKLLIPAEELACDSFEKVRLWKEIALSLLKKYTERYYTFRNREWELPHLEYQELTEDDPNFPKGRDAGGEGFYRILLDRSQDEIVAKLAELKALIENGNLKPWEFSGMKAMWFGRHLYEPLLYLDQKIVEVSPVPLNKGERILVEDVKAFHDGAPKFFADKELYLLRNLSKGRGVGFFEAGNFHPDFIVWLIKGGQQYISFIDPKGIRNLGLTDPKIAFHQTVKEIETRLGDNKVTLNSFIVSNTPSHQMRLLWGVEKADMEARNIVFQEEDKDTYVQSMFAAILK